jgi:hypothetical protein
MYCTALQHRDIDCPAKRPSAPGAPVAPIQTRNAKLVLYLFYLRYGAKIQNEGGACQIANADDFGLILPLAVCTAVVHIN